MGCAITKGLIDHKCKECDQTIFKGQYKVKEVMNNHKVTYYHYECVPVRLINYNFEHWEHIHKLSQQGLEQ